MIEYSLGGHIVFQFQFRIQSIWLQKNVVSLVLPLLPGVLSDVLFFLLECTPSFK
jgi:hypothetical protein